MKSIIAPTQYDLGWPDLATVLALVRGGTLAAAGARMGMDASTVFRSLQRIEKGLGQSLFERSRAGYRPNDLANHLAAHAEHIEAELEAARSTAHARDGIVTGQVRITTTDTILHGLVLRALRGLAQSHPMLQYELQVTNELASLTKRDADIAVRATARPPEHLVGKNLGPIRVAVYAPAGPARRRTRSPDLSAMPWIAPDDALPEHPSVRWRRRHVPKATVVALVNSIQSVTEAVGQGLGVGIVPLFLAAGRKDLVQISPPLDECDTPLWLLTHPESRHLRRVSTVFTHLAETIALVP